MLSFSSTQPQHSQQVIELEVKYDALIDALQNRFLLPENWSSTLDEFLTKTLKPVLTRLEEYTADKRWHLPSFHDLDWDLKVSFPAVASCFDEFLAKMKEIGEDRKTLFRYYANPLLEDFSAAVKTYKKYNLHLAYSAKILLQLGKFDMGSLRVSKSNTEKQMTDAQQRLQEARRASSKAIEDLQTACTEHNVDSELVKAPDVVNKEAAIKRSLMWNVLHTLPEIKRAERLLYSPNLKELILFYKDFATYMQQIARVVTTQGYSTKRYDHGGTFMQMEHLKAEMEHPCRVTEEDVRSAILSREESDFSNETEAPVYVQTESGTLELREPGRPNINDSMQDSVFSRHPYISPSKRAAITRELKALLCFLYQRRHMEKDNIRLAMGDQIPGASSQISGFQCADKVHTVEELTTLFVDGNLSSRVAFLWSDTSLQTAVGQIVSKVSNVAKAETRVTKMTKVVQTKQEEIAAIERNKEDLKNNFEWIKQDFEENMSIACKGATVVVTGSKHIFK